MVGAPGQPEAVHRHGGDGIGGDLKFHAVVDGPGLVVRHGENGAGDQLLQLVLRDADGVAGAHIRQVGVLVGGFGADGKGGEAGADGHPVVVIHHHGDAALGKPADDVAEQSGRQHALAAVSHIGFDLIGDGGFHIVAGEGQTGTRPAEDALDGRQAALLSHRSARNIQPLQQGIFFTGKTHCNLPSCLNIIDIYIYK